MPHAPAERAAARRSRSLNLRHPLNHNRKYISDMQKDTQTSCQKHLSGIEEQVRGVSRMIGEDRYCIDIVTEIMAVRAALSRVEVELLRDHIGLCVEHAIASGDKADQRRKITELMALTIDMTGVWHGTSPSASGH